MSLLTPRTVGHRPSILSRLTYTSLNVPTLLVQVRVNIKIIERLNPQGLFWERSGLVDKPRWKSEPRLEAIEAVCHRILRLQPAENCAIEFFAAGLFDRLYRVSLPASD